MTDNERIFLEKAEKLADKFAQLCYELNKAESKGTAEKYGSVNVTNDGTILLASISCSLQRIEDNNLKKRLEPAVVSISFGCDGGSRKLEADKFPLYRNEWRLAVKDSGKDGKDD